MILQTIRALRRVPGVAIAAILTLALGIAFTTTIVIGGHRGQRGAGMVGGAHRSHGGLTR